MERDYIQRVGPLSSEERIDLERHPVIGEQESARAGADRATNLLVRWHHEWWNGGGYPDGLRGDEIPLAGRILRLADSYMSLTSSRPFRAAHSAAEARHMIIERAGIEFDPRVVQTFLQLEPTEPVEQADEVEPVTSPPESKELFSSFMK
jgi:HD-GYP domain-containing protein (c-di-GMP phosphodiesterase class II)